jgi:hypothetical protein
VASETASRPVEYRPPLPCRLHLVEGALGLKSKEDDLPERDRSPRYVRRIGQDMQEIDPLPVADGGPCAEPHDPENWPHGAR